MNILLNEPFRLCEIEGFGFLIVDQIARKTTFSLTDPMRISGAIRYVLQEAAMEGHLCYRQLECICYAYLLLNDVDYKSANSFCSFYNTDGSCTIGIDNNHYFIIDYDYLAGGYSVRTYAEKSANGYTVTDKQRLARGEKGNENK